MSVNCRFALDEKRYVIDAVNVANSGKGYCHEGDPEDDKYLRERVLMIRLSEMIKKLIDLVATTKDDALDCDGCLGEERRPLRCGEARPGRELNNRRVLRPIFELTN